MDEFLEQFVIESRELVDLAAEDLLELEKAPRDGERLDSAFRAFHTLKGGAGIVDFPAMEEVMHRAENVLSAARAGARLLSAQDIGDCLACLDQVTQWLDDTEATGHLPPDADAKAIVARLPQAPTQAEPVRVQASKDRLPEEEAKALLEAQLALLDEPGPRGATGRLASAGRSAANVVRSLGRAAEAEDLERVTEACAATTDPLPLRQAIEALLGASASVTPGTPQRADGVTQTLRVDAARIDALVKLTGELTVAKNALGHSVGQAEADGSSHAPALKSRHAVLERLVGELQRSVLAMRVLPLRIAFQRFPRLVREMSASLGKPTTLAIEGEDTEADKAIVEMLAEPLLHVLRNAMDHGIEDAATRAAAGKPALATIRLRAAREGEHVVIDVSDDGRGIDVAKVREVALRRGLASAEMLKAMSDAEATDLIFAPGFSTAERVTDVSGRGVGMDAVRTAVRRLGGHVEIGSSAGAGTSIRFTLPFSVMMTQVMTVEAGGQVFGIPLEAIVETLRFPVNRISPVGAAQAIVLRDRTVPLVDLSRVLGTAPGTPAPPQTGDATIVVARIDGELGALRVDKVGVRMEVMLKPLEGLLSGMPGLAGSTLMGDGSVLLVLDLAGLLQ